MKQLSEIILEKLHLNANSKLNDINLLVYIYHYINPDDGTQFFIVKNDDISIGNFLSILLRDEFETKYGSPERDAELKEKIEEVKDALNSDGWIDSDNQVYSFIEFTNKLEETVNSNKDGFTDFSVIFN